MPMTTPTRLKVDGADGPRVPRISLRCTEERSGHGPQVEVAKQTHSHTPAHDGDAEITQDLFLTKLSSIPGEFDPILAPTVDFGGDHLLRFKTKSAPELTRCSRTFGATVQYQD